MSIPGVRGIMARSRQPSSVRLSLEQLEERETPSATALSLQSFDSLTTASLFENWTQWSSATSSFAISAAKASSGNQSLSTTGSSNTAARLWQSQSVSADSGVQATILADSLIPIQIFARGQNLASSTPSYYAVSVTRGLQIELLRVENGVATTLASLKSSGYLSGKWVRVSLTFDGDRLAVEVQRTDTNQYLNSTGAWVASGSTALQSTDQAISAGGFVGIQRQAKYAGTAYIDDFAVLSSAGPTIAQKFNDVTNGGVPSGWSRWSTDGALGFGASSTRSLDGLSLTSSGTSTRASRAWDDDIVSADSQATASVYIDSLVPAQIFVRGNELATNKPDYYAVTVSRGLTVGITKVVDGVSTELATLKSSTYVSGLWVRASITVQGNHLQARVQRLDTGMWLNKFGEWQADATAALDATDSSIAVAGQAGLARPASYSGNVAFDDFDAGSATNDITAPTLSISIPTGGQNLSERITIGVNAADASGIAKVEYYLDGRLVGSTTKSPFDWSIDTRNWNNGSHQLSVRAYDAGGNVSIATHTVTFSNKASYELPSISSHYSHIRVAALAYSGNPMSTTEKTLLQNSIDLVVANPKYLSTIDQTSSATPQLIYSNVSNLYLELLTDWLDYADDHGVSRESAFYHVSEATAFSGSSASSQPVDWFWNVQRGPASGNTGYVKLTSEARNATTGDVSFGAAGQTMYFGYTDKFREINFNLSSGKQNGWTYVVEYTSSVNSEGVGNGWKTLNVISDSTTGLSKSGQWTFDPPSDWKTSMMVGATSPLYYVRIRAVSGTAAQAPVASTITGRDYVNAKGGSTGTIPAFDSAADKNGDGYLSDAEYASRAAGKDARFNYESRLFYPYYGSMRFVTNPGSTSVQNWAADYHERLLASQPLADGIFMDNSSGKSPVIGFKLVESSATYASDYSALLATVNREISPKWVMANTSNGSADTDLVVRQVPATMEEFGIRAMAHNWQQFTDLAQTVSQRQSATDPSGYLILDSLSTGGSPTSARTQMATLAYYYLIGDSKSTMLMLWGGEEPASSWSRHWFNALTYNVGQAQGEYTLFATGADPSNAALTYNIYQRKYDSALVLYKPLSYARGQGNGTTADNTATTHLLGGNYRVLASNGTLGAVVTSITIRNGEGVVLIKA